MWGVAAVGKGSTELEGDLEEEWEGAADGGGGLLSPLSVPSLTSSSLLLQVSEQKRQGPRYMVAMDGSRQQSQGGDTEETSFRRRRGGRTTSLERCRLDEG